MKKIGVWFQNNLRVHDNNVLFEALKTKDAILPFYIFNEEEALKTSYGFRKIGKYRAQFLCECILDLKNNLQKQG
jgi:deoxyribodipyrimidine photo-lyase